MNEYAAARTDKMMTQEELAMAAGISVRTVRRIENGDTVRMESRKAVRAVLGLFDRPVVDHVDPEEVRFVYSIPPDAFVARKGRLRAWRLFLVSLFGMGVMAGGTTWFRGGAVPQEVWMAVITYLACSAMAFGIGATGGRKVLRKPLAVAVLGMTCLAAGMFTLFPAEGAGVPEILLRGAVALLLFRVGYLYIATVRTTHSADLAVLGGTPLSRAERKAAEEGKSLDVEFVACLGKPYSGYA